MGLRYYVKSTTAAPAAVLYGVCCGLHANVNRRERKKKKNGQEITANKSWCCLQSVLVHLACLGYDVQVVARVRSAGRYPSTKKH